MTNNLFSDMSELNPVLAQIENDKKAATKEIDLIENGCIKRKSKTVQADNLINNSCSYVHVESGVTYSVSFGVTASKKGSVGEVAPEQLAKLQSIIKQFIKELPAHIQ